jgi:hypothetical protein
MENTFLKKIIQYRISVGNKENGCSVSDLNIAMINSLRRPMTPTKKSLKKKSLRNS